MVSKTICWGFESLAARQIYLCKALSGCVLGLGPSGLGSNPSTETILLGYSLVWSKATVFEIVNTGSNPVTSAKFRMNTANLFLQPNFLQAGPLGACRGFESRLRHIILLCVCSLMVKSDVANV